MNITKLPSGSYRIRLTEKGQTYSMTVPYKPNKKEAFDLIQKKVNRVPDIMSFENAAQEYISSKKNVLSPATIREYNCILRNLPDDFKKTDITALDTLHVQKLVNDYSTDHSAKSVRNVYGFVRACIRLFYPSMDICCTLPQKVHTSHYTPSQDDVKRILEEAKGTEYYIPIFLATMSLRNSEICALTLDDLDGNTLTINKACVRSDNGYVIKPTPKTDASNRVIVIPDDIADLIRQQGYVYKNYPQQIDKFLRRTQKKLNIPSFGIHRLRHFFASYAHDLGYSDAVIQSIGGWNTDNVMKTVYRHAMNEDEVRKNISKDLTLFVTEN